MKANMVPALREMWSSGSGHMAQRSSSYTCEKRMMPWGVAGREFGVEGYAIVYLRLERYEIKENSACDNNKMNIWQMLVALWMSSLMSLSPNNLGYMFDYEGVPSSEIRCYSQ